MQIESNKIKVAACQVPDVIGDIETSLRWIEDFADQAAAQEVSLVCFPECFLQGYVVEYEFAHQHAIELSSGVFSDIHDRLAALKSVLVFGLIERENNLLFNSAVVIDRGKLIGKYRKTHLFSGEGIFYPGTTFPVFETEGLPFGINICSDSRFPSAAASLASQGATVILCPLTPAVEILLLTCFIRPMKK
jgi:predicted amidohydrolase